MTNFEFGDVILVPFPFTDLSTTKKRPTVVVSSPGYHRERPDIVVMAITSQARAGAFGETAIQGWQAAGLLKPSVIKPVIATIEQGLVIKQLGRLTDQDRKALAENLRIILG